MVLLLKAALIIVSATLLPPDCQIRRAAWIWQSRPSKVGTSRQGAIVAPRPGGPCHSRLRGRVANQMSDEGLKALSPVQKKLEEAKKSLATYRDVLNRTCGDMLRLHVYAVVAVGFERMVSCKL